MSDVALKVNEQTFGEVFNKLWPGFKAPFDEEVSALLYLRIEGEFHIVGAGKVEFNDGDTFTASEIDLAWDKLILHVGIDIPTITVGKFCIMELPPALKLILGVDCIEFPGGEVFTASPEYKIKLNLNAIVQFLVTEISTIADIEVKKGSKDGQDYWGIHLDPEAVNVDLVDIEDTLGQADALVVAGIAAAVKYINTIVPATFVIDVLLGVVGFSSLSEYILDILDIQDDVEEWLMRTLKVSIGIDQIIYQILLDFLLSSAPLYKIDDPISLMKEEIDGDVTGYGGFGTDGNAPPPPPPPPPSNGVTLNRVLAKVNQPDVVFSNDEMVVTFDFGN